MFLGDLNVMGMQYPFNKSIRSDIEHKKLSIEAQKIGMKCLVKNNPTWWKGPEYRLPPADLDQVFASSNIKFRKFSNAEVDVRGWVNFDTDSDKVKWIKSYSDHSLLYLEILK